MCHRHWKGQHALGRVLWVASICAVAAPSLPTAKAEERPLGIAECAVDLRVPRYGPGDTPGESDGPVTVSLKLGSAGRVASMAVTGGTGKAQTIVKSSMQESAFSEQCAGRVVMIVFIFRTEGPPQEYPFSWVSFQSPNRFTVHSRARKVRIFRTRAPEE